MNRTIFVATLLLPGVLRSQEQPKTHQVVRPELYEKVLDLVFESDEAHRGYDFVLRFEPSNAPELQISVKTTNGKTQALEYTPLSGNIYGRLNAILRNGGKEDIVELTKQIQVRKRISDVPASQVTQWWSRLPDSMAATLKLLEHRRAEELKGFGTVTLDGTHYSFSYVQPTGDVIVRVWDEEINPREVTGQIELVRWMNRVRRDIENLK
jgi:hypothetical protein